ncbi:HNH endonuclease [Xylophilus rhododendri]|uniref:Putative HNH nuclease YajD n=1 Tax=Xylophilus rhododendri TaxID=2697032 RepID=A0A857J5U7_9BURK|nr:HNH endonuclease signature motif containing protein [Xylophilus rhododendri]QHI99350.1 HNH endonuclease [Xylophilus rhododendri]
MPVAAPRPCTYPGCGRLVRDGSSRCESHRRFEQRQFDQQRGSAASRGYDSAWQRAREGFLRAHPLCASCEKADLVTPATVVDHIVPHRNDKVLFWTRSNWQPLCKKCHDIKTATEDGGFGRRK